MAIEIKKQPFNTPKNKNTIEYLSDLGKKLMNAFRSKNKTKDLEKITPEKVANKSINRKSTVEKSNFVAEKSKIKQPQNRISTSAESTTDIAKPKETSKISPNKIPIPPMNEENPWQRSFKNYKEEGELVIGFDLGTSSTKVIIQDKILRKAFAVPFDDLCNNNNRYLLPTKLFLDSNKLLSLNPNAFQIDNLKVNFMGNPDLKLNKNGLEATNQDFVSAYIGLVLIKVCQWFWETKHRDYAHLAINWELNIGIPAKTWDNTELSKTMKKTALAGWNLSLEKNSSISINDVERANDKAFEQIKKNEYDWKRGQLHPELVTTVPELIAEVMGFAKSQSRRNGMYLLTDVGASTLDISTFILHEDQAEENIFTILCSDVKPFGVYNLHKYRIKKFIKNYMKEFKALDKSYDGISALPDCSAYESILNDVDYEKFKNSEQHYLNECSIVVRKVVKETRKNRNPLSQAWETGVPAFLCGGGSQVDLYKKLIPYSGEKLRPTNFNGFDIKNLPKPDNLENEDILPQNYHRLAVSYGLSFSVDNMGKIIPARDLEDIVDTATKTNIDERFVNKDMV